MARGALVKRLAVWFTDRSCLGVLGIHRLFALIYPSVIRYTIGMRCVYLSFPNILWFFGDWVMFATGLALIPCLYWLDFRSEEIWTKKVED